jgi:dGTPase
MSFRLDWDTLLSDRRYGQGDAPHGRPGTGTRLPRSEFEKDHDRVIFSAPFRRLAGKTQVHPFATLEHVHNRLTHTLEVSSVGRSLAYAVGRLLTDKGVMPAGRGAEDLSCIVQAACLAHDLGNPPFGHAGEYAIRDWVRLRSPDLLRDIPPGLRDDWLHFEGNAQSLRMVAAPEEHEQPYFHFTYASLGALIKYPWSSDDPRASSTGKHNAFSTERAIFEDLVATLGLRRPDGAIVRHPLSFLAEAADDICYRVGDFEDAVEMGILDEAKVRAIFNQIIGRESPRPLPSLRARAIGRMVEAAATAFAENYDEIMTGKRAEDLKTSFPAEIQQALGTIKRDYHSIFGHRAKVAVELGAPAILGRILDAFVPAVRALALARAYEPAQLGFISCRCLALGWPETYLRAHADRGEAWWLARLMDLVAGMTDSYATRVSREIAGV